MIFLLLVMPFAALSPAHAQSGGIQVAPVMVTMTGERNISSLRVRNGRERPVSFEIDAYAWSQRDGREILVPTNALLVAPGVFEIPAHGEQVVRLGVPAPVADTEVAYRIVLRELPTARASGAMVGFTLEMSLPVFLTPMGARSEIETHLETRQGIQVMTITNAGHSHAQILALEDSQTGSLDAPRYLLAGASVDIPLPLEARALRLRTADLGGAHDERILHADRAPSLLLR